MSREKWLEAATKYASKTPPVQQSKPFPDWAPAAVCKPGTSVEEISNALLFFETSQEGQAALQLLRVSKRHVVIIEENEGGGYGCVYFLDGFYYKRSVEAMGTWQVYSKEVKQPEEETVSVQELAQAIFQISRGTVTAEGVLAKMRRELDAIAAQADK